MISNVVKVGLCIDIVYIVVAVSIGRVCGVGDNIVYDHFL